MPTYDYQCRKCENVFEVFHSMSESPKPPCPDCAGESEKMIGAGGGILFKGSGFYTTDYRSESYKKAAKNDSSS